MVESTVLAQLFQVGVAGVMLAWFMYRVERKLDAFARATDRSTRAMLLLVLNLPSARETSKRAARRMIREIPTTSNAEWEAVEGDDV